MLKLLFQELQVWPTTLGRDSQPSGAHLETTKPLCSRERQKTTHLGLLTTQGENAAVFLNLVFPEFQNPLLHFVLCYKKGGLKENVRWSIRVKTSQIAVHLNKATIKIQFLFLLIGFGMGQAARMPAFLVSVS